MVGSLHDALRSATEKAVAFQKQIGGVRTGIADLKRMMGFVLAGVASLPFLQLRTLS